MIDNLNDKGQALSSSQIRAKLKQLNNKYNTLRALAQVRLCVIWFFKDIGHF